MISPSEGAHLLSGFGDINGFMHADLDLPQPMFALPVYSNLNGLDWAGQQPAVIVRVGQNQLNNTPETGCQLGALSVDGGANWTTFGTCQPLLNSTNTDAGTIALDATGTCLVWSAASISLEGNNPMSNESGPYYSLDRGDSWNSPTGLQAQTPNITSDKVQNGTFYSYTDGVWYLSTDGGRTYVASNGTDIDLPESSGALPVVDFAHAGHVYLPLGEQGIYHTSDFGSSWTRISREGVWPSLLTVGAPAQGRTNPALYIWGTISANGTTGLYRSDDNGAGWVRINDDAHQYGGPGLIQGDPRVYGRVYIGTGGRGIVRADVVASMSTAGGVVPGTGGI
jgi:oligoxyloglucan reducing-end-specific cellobiohydrolase